MTIVDIEIGNMCSFFSEITSGIYIFRMEIKYSCIILSRSNIFVFQINFWDSQPKKKTVCTVFFLLVQDAFSHHFMLVYWACFQLKKSFHVHSSVLEGVPPSMFTHSKFSLHNVSSSYNMVYSKLFLVWSGLFARNKSLQWSVLFQKFYHQKRSKSIWNPSKVWDSKLTCSELLTIRLIGVSSG
jgi:hypothetical protein